MKSKSKGTGFSIVELLTVMSIIVILLSLLLPSLAAVRRYAKKVRQKGQFHDIRSGMEMFRIDFDGYPDSDWKDPCDLAYCGAMKLCEAMVGQDGLGFHPDSIFRRDGWDAAGVIDLYRAPPPPITPTERRERKQPYIDIVDKYKMCPVEELYADPSPFDPNSTVLSDIYFKIKGKVSSGEKFGMPVLYYKADVGKLGNDPNVAEVANNIYNFGDNNALVGLKVDGDDHPLYVALGDLSADVFYKNIYSKTIAGFERSFNEDSYILISAGWDSLYGTRDDVYNFPEK